MKQYEICVVEIDDDILQTCGSLSKIFLEDSSWLGDVIGFSAKAHGLERQNLATATVLV